MFISADIGDDHVRSYPTPDCTSFFARHRAVPVADNDLYAHDAKWFMDTSPEKHRLYDDIPAAGRQGRQTKRLNRDGRQS
jgi:hypothetical protein